MAPKRRKKSRREIHVVPCRAARLWLTVTHGEILAKHVRKSDAVKLATFTAQAAKVELIVHNADGRIAWRNSYGNDPKNRKG